MGHTLGPPGQGDLPGDLETVPAVERDVALLGGLEVRPGAVAVAALQDGCEQRGADALPLVDGIGAEHRQVPVRCPGCRRSIVDSTRNALGTLRPKAAISLGDPRRICPKLSFQCPGGSHRAPPARSVSVYEAP